MIRILIADDHQMFLDGIASILEQEADIEIVAKCLSGGEVIEQMKMKEVLIDVAVLDINMPGLTGIDLIEKVQNKAQNAGIIMLTMHAEEEFIRQALQKGVNGYVLKESPKEDFITAVRKAAKGEPFFSHKVTEAVIRGMTKPYTESTYTELTKREIEVLQLIAHGKKTKTIAEELFISDHTVMSHRRALLEKTGAANAAALVRYAIENDLLEG
jgi:DNA-binding NarL/FixJ family response regulator